MQAETISIIGLDRTGVSIGLAFKQSSLPVTVIGSDPDATRLQTAKKAVGAVDQTTADMAQAAAAGDIVLLAVPADRQQAALAGVVSRLKSHALLLDLGALKGPSRQWAAARQTAGHYVGAAPVLTASALLDGREAALSARADLFAGSIWALLPAAEAGPAAVDTAVQVVRLLGAEPFFMDVDEYDGLIQSVEALPGLIAAAIFQAVTRTNGWRDLARLAGQPFAQMIAPLGEATAVATQAGHNQQASLRWLDAAIAELEQVRAWVAESEPELLAARLQSLAEEYAAWQQQRIDQTWQEKAAARLNYGMLGGHVLGRRGGSQDGE